VIGWREISLCSFVVAYPWSHAEQRDLLAGDPASARRPSRCQDEASR